MVDIELVGVIVNGLGIALGTVFGLFFNKINERIKETIMAGIGLTVIALGFTMGLESDRTIVILLSLLFGAVIGEGIDLDEKLNRVGAHLEVRFKKEGKESNIAEGFVTALLIFCVGALAVIGPLDSGIHGNHEILYTKSILDGFTALVLTTTLGFGVIFSLIPVVIYEGVIALFATQIDQFFPESFFNLFIEDMTATGGLLIVAIGLNLLNVTRIRVANLLPSLVIVGFVLFIYLQVPNWFS